MVKHLKKEAVITIRNPAKLNWVALKMKKMFVI